MTIDTLWYTRCPVPTAFGVAVERGLLDTEFAADKIAVRSLASTTDVSVRQSHFHHSQPNSFRHGGNGPPLVSRSRGADVRLIGLSWNDSIKPMLVMPDSGLRQAADLKGKRISVPVRASDSIDFWKATAMRGTELALRAGQLNVGDVELTVISTNRAFMDDATTASSATVSLWGADCMLGHQREEAFALIRGDVDAIYSQGAIAAVVQGFTGAIAVTDNSRYSSLADRVNNDAPLALTVSGRLLDERPDLVIRALASILQAAEWASRNERAAKRIIATDTGLAEELVDTAFSSDVHQQLKVELRPEWIAGLRVQHDHLKRHSFLKEAVDFDKFIDPEPLLRAQELAARKGALID